ncbi:MAG: YceI family protein, partial [Terracidiphilus sp.]
MKTIVSTLFLTLPLILVPVASAQHQSFTVNPDSSKIAFSLGGNTHHVDGTFHVQSGSIDFDRSAQTISGAVVVAAGSGNSGDQGRDKKMNSDVLDVAHFSEVSFVPKSYQGTVAA